MRLSTSLYAVLEHRPVADRGRDGHPQIFTGPKPGVWLRIGRNEERQALSQIGEAHRKRSPEQGRAHRPWMLSGRLVQD